MLILHIKTGLPLVLGNYEKREVDQVLLCAVARAHKWFLSLTSGEMKSFAEIASKEGVDKSYVSRIIPLAFLSPQLIETIMEGRQPVNLTLEKLTKQIKIPLNWQEQHKLFGI